MQLKITGGTYKGKRLKTNKNAQLRPTTEKTRLAIFDTPIAWEAIRMDLMDKLLSESKDRIKNNPEFFNYYGLRSLYEGNFDDGWKYYEYRNSKLVDFFKETKEWNGEKIDNHSIVVFNEQGLGDSIQFSKYIIPLTKIANKVSFVVQDNIQNLLRQY